MKMNFFAFLRVSIAAISIFSTCAMAAEKVSWMDSKKKIVGKKSGKQNSSEILEELNKKRSIAAQYLEQITHAESHKIAEASLKNIDHIIVAAKKLPKDKSIRKYSRLVNDELSAIKFVKKLKADNVKKDMPVEVAEFLMKRMNEVKDALSKLQVDSIYQEVLLPNIERHLKALEKATDKAAKFVGARVLLRKIHSLENMMLFYRVK
jgi:hypothetical protein